jgi:hypothetical protein
MVSVPEDGSATACCSLKTFLARLPHRSFSRRSARKIDGLQFLAHELLAVFGSVAGHQHAVRIQRNVETIGQHAQRPRACSKLASSISRRTCAGDALVQGGVKPVGLEDLLDHLALVGAQVEAVHSGRGAQRRLARRACCLLVEGDFLTRRASSPSSYRCSVTWMFLGSSSRA